MSPDARGQCVSQVVNGSWIILGCLMVMSKLHDSLAVLNWSKLPGGLVMRKPNRLETKDIQTKCLCGEAQRWWADWTGHILPTVRCTRLTQTGYAVDIWAVCIDNPFKNLSEHPSKNPNEVSIIPRTQKRIFPRTRVSIRPRTQVSIHTRIQVRILSKTWVRFLLRNQVNIFPRTRVKFLPRTGVKILPRTQVRIFPRACLAILDSTRIKLKIQTTTFELISMSPDTRRQCVSQVNGSWLIPGCPMVMSKPCDGQVEPNQLCIWYLSSIYWQSFQETEQTSFQKPKC